MAAKSDGAALARVSEAAEAAHDLEALARPLLDVLKELTGFQSVYLTRIHWAENEQEILFAVNGGPLSITAGSKLVWQDTLCRRVLMGEPPYTDNVPKVFPESEAARRWRMRTFASFPVVTPDAEIFGTLCGASTSRHRMDAPALKVMPLFARLIADQIARDREFAAQRARADRAEAMAGSDALTGLANRRAFEDYWGFELARSARHGYPLCVVVLGIDRFRAINEGQGQALGDRVLRAVADVLVRSLRSGDIVARMGGDKFVFGLPYTDLDGAVKVTERVRELVAGSRFDSSAGNCTLSAGVACSASTPALELLEAADHALTRAKANGRNRVEVFKGPLKGG